MGQSSDTSAAQVVEAEIQPDTANSVIREKVTKKWQSYITSGIRLISRPKSVNFSSNSTLLYMKEQLSLYSNRLNYMQTAWTVGYVIGEIPSNIILTRIRPSIWIPTLEVRRRVSFVKKISTNCCSRSHGRSLRLCCN